MKINRPVLVLTHFASYSLFGHTHWTYLKAYGKFQDYLVGQTLYQITLLTKKNNSEKNFKLFSKVTQLLVRVEHMGKAIKCFMDLCVP